MLRDLLYSARALRKSWGFALVAILTLGLGVGANTAIFSVINGVLLKPLEFADPDQIVTLWHAGLDGSYSQNTTTPANFYAWQEQASSSFDAMAAYSTTGRTATGQGDPEQLVGVISAGSIFDVLQVQPAFGRTFTIEEDRPGAEPVVVISLGFGNGCSARIRTSKAEPSTSAGPRTPSSVSCPRAFGSRVV